MVEHDKTEQQAARRSLMRWIMVGHYAGLGGALLAALAFGLWQGSPLAGLWMGLVLVAAPLSVSVGLAVWWLIAQGLTESLKE